MELITDISGIRAGALRSLKPILNMWVDLSGQEKWFFEEDATWWNNERATLSIFAGAVWRSGGLVMEEFATEKIKRSVSETGRCDIIFRIGRKVYLGEAKQDWPRLTDKNLRINLKETNRVIKQACFESLQTKNENSTHLGIVFITPFIHESRIAHLDEYLYEYISGLCKLENIIVAWTFPKWARHLHSLEAVNKNKIYPGVILAIKKAD